MFNEQDKSLRYIVIFLVQKRPEKYIANNPNLVIETRCSFDMI